MLCGHSKQRVLRQRDAGTLDDIASVVGKGAATKRLPYADAIHDQAHMNAAVIGVNEPVAPLQIIP